MADVQEIPTADRKARKSVAFSEGATVVDGDGHISQIDSNDPDKSTAESHSADTNGTNGAVDEVTDMMANLAKKKKKSKKPKEGDDDGAAADGEFDPTAMKKKKKKKAKAVDADDFEAKLKEVGAAGDNEGGEDGMDGADGEAEEGDLIKGTGIWAHDATGNIKYNHLLSRFFTLLHAQHPDLASSSTKNYKIPPPQCLRENNKKTIFANLNEICRRMKRPDEHVIQFLFVELGTNGSVDGSKRLVIKGRFQQKQIENVLRKYIVEYVTCKTCWSLDTELNKGENRLYFVTCNSCGSRRSVTAIKSGFMAQVGKRRRQQK